MKKTRLSPYLVGKGKLLITGIALLAILVSVASARGRREGVSNRETAKGFGASNPDPVGGAPTPQPTGSVTEGITPDEARRLLTEFQKAQFSELKALEHRHKLELKELKASQAARQKDWERTEREARHKYFAEHRRGPDRRAFVQDSRNRRKVFIQVLDDERSQRVREQEVRFSAMKSDQQQRLKEFRQALSEGKRPDPRLWPGG